jgi:hypothetical protein
MTTFDRRRFFSAAIAAAGFTAAPSWCTAWFLPQDPDDTARERQLRAAAAKAKAEGKPLLVFVVPDDENAAHVRGEWLGAWLVHGGASARLDLALCQPAAASAQEVRALARLPLPAPVPALLLLDAALLDDADGLAMKCTPIEVDLPAASAPERPEDLARLSTALAAALPQHAGALDAMAQRVRASLPDADTERVLAWLAGGRRLDDELLVRVAAWVRSTLPSMKAEPARAAQARLLAAIERVWMRRPLPGARWGRTEGCGVDIEDPAAPGGVIGAGVECGMGRVPDVCRRFLVFYTGS